MKTKLLKQIRKRFEILRVDKFNYDELSIEDKVRVKSLNISTSPFYIIYYNDWNNKYFVRSLPDAENILKLLIREIYTHDRKVQGFKTIKIWY